MRSSATRTVPHTRALRLGVTRAPELAGTRHLRLVLHACGCCCASRAGVAGRAVVVPAESWAGPSRIPLGVAPHLECGARTLL